jgi:protein N-terminal amidase
VYYASLVAISLISFLASGTGFATFDLPPPLRRMSLAICMDLNPHPPNEWTSIEGPYELADYCLSKRTNVLILLDAWLDSGNEPDDTHDWHTLKYWSARLRPLWKSDEDALVDSDDGDQQETAQDAPGDEMIVIACNRCGEEKGMPVSLDRDYQLIKRL